MQRCHLTAPLMAHMEDGWIILTCYVPDCGREVWRGKIEGRK